MRWDTLAVHAGTEPDPSTGAIMTPVYMTSTYVQEAPGVHKGYEYSRTKNPTRSALEEALAALEQGRFGLALSSGMAAADLVMHLLKPGDKILATNDLYGGTYRLFKQVYEPLGFQFTFTDLTKTEKVAELLKKERYQLLWIETPTNPLLKVYDIAQLCEIAKEQNTIVVVDNTFASPYLQQPLTLGATIVLHSATKYLGGHSDVVLGALILNDETLAEKLYFLQNSIGSIAGPMDSYLVLRGIKTLHVRMERHCKNAMAVAKFLSQHPKVKVVHYPGLSSHPQHAIAKRQMKNGFGGMVSFELVSDNIEDGIRFMQKLKIFSLAESLGGVESLVSHPASMTHASIAPEERRKAGLNDTLIRLSVGIEDEQDLIEDLEQALNAI